MKMISVNSSNLNSVGYENGTLYIKFHSGGLYLYKNVPEHVYMELINADSHGIYFHENIKKCYPYQRLY